MKRVLAHYEQQSDEQAVAEDEAAYELTTHTAMEVPVDLVPGCSRVVDQAPRWVGRVEAQTHSASSFASPATAGI